MGVLYILIVSLLKPCNIFSLGKDYLSASVGTVKLVDYNQSQMKVQLYI